MIRYFVQLEYKGTNYSGFQKQRNTRNTVQAKLNKALSAVANHKVLTVCAGRTDSGVHATNQIVHFDTNSKRTLKSWINGANRYLPDDISIKGVYKVENKLHARFDATSRTYKYLIRRSEQKIGLLSDSCLWIRKELNINLMNKACIHLLGEKDFTSFRASGCQANSAVRSIYEANLKQKGPFIIFHIRANAFLLNMIRIIVGTLIQVGTKDISVPQFKRIIQSKKRSLAGKTVEPKGLYFYGPEYNTFQYQINECFIDELD